MGQSGGAEVLAGEGAAVEQVPAALPVRGGFVGGRLLGDEHDVLDQRVPDRLRHGDEQVDVIGADDDHRGGEQLIGVGHRLAQRRPIVAVDCGEIVGTPDRGALVAADRVGGGDAVGEETGDGRGVEPLDMIAFQEGVDDELPVGGDVVGRAAIDILVGDGEGIEVGGKCKHVGEVGVG